VQRAFANETTFAMGVGDAAPGAFARAVGPARKQRSDFRGRGRQVAAAFGTRRRASSLDTNVGRKKRDCIEIKHPDLEVGVKFD
jgi:hypothetical protein